jgi:protein-tyrosine phosphatase
VLKRTNYGSAIRRSAHNRDRGRAGDNGGVSLAIDLHCHILPALDDGARDLSDAIAMARQAQDDGIGEICATPHIRHDHDVRIPELPGRVAALAAAVREAGCAARILPGAEVAATALDGLDDHELAAVSLGGSRRWVLLEPAPGPLDDRFETAVDRLGGRGFRALVAHPERHLAPDLTGRLRRLVTKGALVQATAAFLSDETVRPGMLVLARAGVVHVLGSDAHSSRGGRPVALAAALEVLGTVEPTASHLDWVARAAPRAIVRGEELTPPF